MPYWYSILAVDECRNLGACDKEIFETNRTIKNFTKSAVFLKKNINYKNKLSWKFYKLMAKTWMIHFSWVATPIRFQ